MLIGIDHVALATDDPDAAAAELERKLGLAPEGGGRHEALGTFNRLIWLGDAYLELVGVFDRELAATNWFGRSVLAALDAGGGLATWAIAVDDVEDALRWGPPDGGLIGPIDGRRERPDGGVVRWRLARTDAVGPTTPLVIEHDVLAAEWTPDERAARAEERHPVGGRVRLAGIEIVTPSPAVAAGALRRLLAVAVEPAGRGAVRVRLGSGDARFVVERPRGAALVELVADVPLRTRAARIGDCEIRLRGLPLEPLADPGDERHRDASDGV